MLTAIGIKPECKFQQVFKSTYLYGAFSPLTGNMFCLELPFCNSENFQLFIPPYSPELNAAEKIWWTIKRDFTNRLFTSLDQLSNFMTESLLKLNPDKIKSICAYDYIF